LPAKQPDYIESSRRNGINKKESDPEFIKAGHDHSAVESNINELEQRGLDRCPDKGIKEMRRYVGLAVIAYKHCNTTILKQDIVVWITFFKLLSAFLFRCGRGGWNGT